MRHSWKCAMRRWRCDADVCLGAVALSFLPFEISQPSLFPSFLIYWLIRSIVNGCRLQSIRSIARTYIFSTSPLPQRSVSLVRISDSGWRVIWSLVCGSLISLLQRRLQRLLCIDSRTKASESSSPIRHKNIVFRLTYFLSTGPYFYTSKS